MNDEDRIDRATLAGLRRELGPGFGRVVGYFREDGERAVAAIEAAVRARDAVAIVGPAHKLKSESLQLGAAALGRTAQRIEKAARQAVEDHVFPIEVIEQAVALRELYAEAAASLTLETIPPPPPAARRAAGIGFGRKRAG